MRPIVKRFPKGTLVIRTELTVTSIASSRPGEKVVCDAVWDTGANASAISLGTARKLGLAPVQTAFFSTANGRCEMPVYMVDMILPNGYEIKDIMVSGLDIQVCDALIGMDVMTRGDMLISNTPCPRFEFRIPSKEVPSLT